MSLLLLSISEWHASFYIPSAYAKLGLSMDTGDVNGDGLEDLLVWHVNYSGLTCKLFPKGKPFFKRENNFQYL